MQATPTDIEGVMVFEPKVFGDARGFFLESFRQQAFDAAVGRHVEFVQDNHSRSPCGVLRGLHWQESPHAQGKLVRVTHGSVFDVAVDIRRGSPTFGRWFGLELSDANHRQLWIGPGLAHGFLVTSESADFLYKATAYYAPQAERAIRWDDPDLGIAWPDVGTAPRVSSKDAGAAAFASLAGQGGVGRP
ncbi:MAG: dTDP-4-dehydrorhamnose 3,5-epimerase [Caldimonas sp.]